VGVTLLTIRPPQACSSLAVDEQGWEPPKTLGGVGGRGRVKHYATKETDNSGRMLHSPQVPTRTELAPPLSG
jgi:hypothetical protein